MKKITSFQIDHTNLLKGISVSRTDGDIVTFDVRMRAPYTDPVLTDVEIHSVEHLLAAALRNGQNADKVIYVGPMGCATGFYVLYRNLDKEAAVTDILNGFKTCLTLKEMPGNSARECGNCRTLDLETGKEAIRVFLDLQR